MVFAFMLFMFVRLFLKSGGVLIFFQSPSGATHGLNTNSEASSFQDRRNISFFHLSFLIFKSGGSLLIDEKEEEYDSKRRTPSGSGLLGP